jgi:hypothetical protein
MSPPFPPTILYRVIGEFTEELSARTRVACVRPNRLTWSEPELLLRSHKQTCTELYYAVLSIAVHGLVELFEKCNQLSAELLTTTADSLSRTCIANTSICRRIRTEAYPGKEILVAFESILPRALGAASGRGRPSVTCPELGSRVGPVQNHCSLILTYPYHPPSHLWF